MASTKEVWLAAPSSQVDPQVIKLIQERWDDTPTSLQVLEVQDKCVHYGWSSDFVVTALQVTLEVTLKSENTTLEDILPQATWREEMV